MKRLITMLAPMVLLVPLVVSAQSRGVRFERGVSWQEVQAMAKAASKYLFVYVCPPRAPACQSMDTSVFGQDRVAAAINPRFIAVKVRGNTSSPGDGDAEHLYTDAPPFRQYHITTFPTFLFFAPDGRLVHRAVGDRDVDGFLALATDALDPARQYYVLRERYERGTRDYGVMAYLARTARALDEMDLARRVARDYFDHLSASERYTRDDIRFIATFTERSSDPGFAMFFQHADTIDQIVDRRGYAESVVRRVISREEIEPIAFPGGELSTAPEWTAITVTITRKYGSTYAERTVIDAQIRWSQASRDWSELTRYTVRKLERYGSSLSTDDINRLTWDLFLYSDDKQALATAITLMEPVANAVDQNPAGAGFFGPAYIDTYANLLYKVGRTAEAIAWEEKAVRLSPRDSFLWEDHTSMLAKMKRGEPTWPQERE